MKKRLSHLAFPPSFLLKKERYCRKSGKKVLRCMKLSFILVLAACLQVSAKGYSQDDVSLSLHLKQTKLSRVLSVIERKVNCRFLYSDDIVPVNKRIDLAANNIPLPDVLNKVLEGTGLHFKELDNHVIVIAKKGTTIIQRQEVSGTVTDEEGNLLAGVTVQVKGSNNGTVTDGDGKFTLDVPDNATLVFSSVGYESKEVVVNGQTTINVSLEISSSTLNELVVTGYTTQKKKDLTGAVTVVDVDDMTKIPSGTVTKQLQGHASGVTVIGSGQPGVEPQVTIRGVNTFGNNTPLYVVDGVPTQNISDLNPNDVASMQVLKDAGAASIYGSRASNGVIIITTKRGKGKMSVTYDGYYGTQRPRSGNVWNILSPIEMAQLKFLASENSGTPVTSASPDPLYGPGPEPELPDYIYPTGASEGDPEVDPSKYYVNPHYTSTDDLNTFYRINKANKAGTDWYHEVNKPAPIQSHNIAVSGGNDQGNYFFSLNYFNQQGTVIYTHLKRYSIRSNTQFNISDRIRIGENLEYSITDNPTIDPGEGSTLGWAWREQPIIPVYDIMGNFAGNYGGQLGNGHNPVADAYRSRNNEGRDNRLFGNIYADVDILENLTFHTSFGGESYAGYYHSFGYPTYENVENTTTNNYYESSYYGHNWTWTNTLQYHKNFNGIHDLKVLVGTEAYESKGRDMNARTYDYFSFDPNYVNLSTGAGTKTNASSRYSEGLWSQFARLDYGYKSKYLFSATIRRDGSSKFLTYQYGWFPAASAAWRISQEDFMQSIPWITDLKLRVGYGVMGNQLNVSAGNAFDTYNSSKDASYYDITGSNNSIQQGFRVGQIGNPDAKWEKDINANIGIDATLFRGKVELTADYYQKDIKDLLYNPTLPGTAGQGTVPYVNIAGMKNHGVDLSISTYANITPELKFNGSLSFTTYHNEISKVTGSTDYFEADDKRRFGINFIRNQVGHPVSAFYGYKIIGFWDSQDEIAAANALIRSKTKGDTTSVYQTDIGLGRFRYADVNGDSAITNEDRTFLGNPNPEFTYGINLSLTYKNFDFSMFLYGVYGNQIWNDVLWWTDFYQSFAGGKSKTALYDSWTPDHKNAKTAIQEIKGTFSTSGIPNSYYVESGSYLRAKNVMLGYTFSLNALQRIGIERLRIYLQAGNLFTITNYSGVDPEVVGNGVTDNGIDTGAYPSTRQYIFGINLKF